MKRKPARKKKPQPKGKAGRAGAPKAKDRFPLTREVFEQFMDHVPAATFIKDADGRTLYFNRFVREALGADESWLGRRTDEVWPGEVGKSMRRDDAEAMRKGFQEREETVPGCDGTARDYHTQKFAIPVKGAAPLLGGIALDISKRKAALRALEASETKLRAIFESAGDGIALADPTTRRFLTVNLRFADMFGYDREEILRLGIDEMHPAESRAQAMREFEAHANGMCTHTPELVCQRKDGSTFFVSVTSSRVALPDGIMQMGIFRNVTEQKVAEEALRSSEERFRVMIENAPFGVALVDEGGYPVLVNRAIEEMLGYTADQLRRMRFTEVTHPDDAAIDDDLFQEVLRGERESYRMEKRYIRADGEIVWGSLGLAGVRDRNGVLTHIIGMVENITARKRIEEDLRDIQAKMLQTQKLESLGVLAGGIAHDFNNLLMAIVGHAEAILEEMPKDSRLLASAREIEIASRRGAELCRQMLAYSGRSQPATEFTDLNAIVGETLRFLEASATKGVNIVQVLGKDLPPARVAEAQMRQIVKNLVINAAEALPDGAGNIVVTTGVGRRDRAFLAGSHVDDGLAEGEYLTLDVRDTGVGMDDATKTRIFDPFFTTKFSGRGLGLASVLGIVRANSGAIRVDSEPRKGSTFTVVFPATVRAPAPGGPVGRSAPEWRGNGVVLVIDDETGVRSVTARHLERSGFQALTAENGHRGLELLNDHAQIGLVILDLAMPLMSGDECLARIRGMRPDLPVIMASGYDEATVIQKMRGAPVSGFLQKPYKRWELLAVVRRILGDDVVPDGQMAEMSGR